MFKLQEIIAGDATRQVRLENLRTGVVEVCFDDSALVSDNNFDFMKVGQQYNCKIKLFGKPVPNKTDNSITCRVNREKVMIGQKVLTEVVTGDGVYYISPKKIAEYLAQDYFEFCCTRKDLVQVNSTVHGDFLHD